MMLRFNLNRLKIRPAIVVLLIIVLFGCRLSCQTQAQPKPTVMVTMRDGVKLATDLYLPTDGGKHPVVLVRTPYNKDPMADAVQEGVKRGYVVVVQDTR